MKNRILVAVLAALLAFVWTAPPAFADQVGNPFCKGQPTPQAVAALVQKSLDVDPSGKTPLDPNACHREHPARPLDYLLMFQIDDPDAPRDISGLVAYLMEMTIGDAPPGKYWMACLKPISGQPFHDCLPRKAKTGEKFWFTRKGRPALAQDCSNPIGRPETPDTCVYLDFYSQEGDEVNLGQTGPTDLSLEKVCTPTIQRAGETDSESPKVQECPDVGLNCTWQSGQPLWWTGSFVLHAGKNRIRLPVKITDAQFDYRMWFCLKRATDSKKSCGLGVQWFDYVPQEGTKVATIFYLKEESLAAKPVSALGNPVELWWDFAHLRCPD